LELGFRSRVEFKLGDRTKRGYSNVKGFAVGANAEEQYRPCRDPKWWIEARVDQGAEFAEHDSTAE
jgi:hypothetical protein